MIRSAAVRPATGAPLRIAVVAADWRAAARLARLVGRSGHIAVDTLAAADAVLSDGSALPRPGPPVVALGAAEADCEGILVADAGAQALDAALRAVVAGLVVRSPAIDEPRFGPLCEAPAPILTPREVEVLTAFGDGLSNKQAARRLGISPHTVKFHSEQLFRKLGANSRAEAVAKGLRRQIVEF